MTVPGKVPQCGTFWYATRMLNATRLWLRTIVNEAVSLSSVLFAVFIVASYGTSGAAERFGMFIYVAATALYVCGFVAGLIGPSYARRSVWILSVPGVVMLVRYTFSEPQNAVRHLAYALLASFAAYAGTRGGARLRTKMEEAAAQAGAQRPQDG
jgi:hypothetical protein